MQRTIAPHRSTFADLDIEIELPQVDQQLSEAALLDIIPAFDGVVAGDEPFTAPVIERAEKLRIISKWGAGTDNIDFAAAEARGIRVTNTPGRLAGEVADVVVGYLVLLARRLHTIDGRVRSGEWAQIEGRSLGGKVLGVIGLGAIGNAVCRRAMAMEMRVLGHDVGKRQRADARELGVEVVDFRSLLAAADFVTLNCALTPATRHMLGADELAGMRPGAFLINTARGPLVDEPKLVDALQSGRLAGAALDVFESEPLPADSPLRTLEGCILGAHNGSNTREAIERVNEAAITNLLDGLSLNGP
jgi:D-3-phosphoglycerate dehydrogenase